MCQRTHPLFRLRETIIPSATDPAQVAAALAARRGGEEGEGGDRGGEGHGEAGKLFEHLLEGVARLPAPTATTVEAGAQEALQRDVPRLGALLISRLELVMAQTEGLQGGAGL